MGLFISRQEKKKKKKKNLAKTLIKAAIQKMIAVVSMLLLKLIPLLLVCCVVFVVIDFVIELFTGKSTPDKIYAALDVQELSELVQIKGNETSGYYLDFVEDFDNKVGLLIKEINSTAGAHNLPNSDEFMKKLIKAEVVTQFPNLGGEIPEGSNGFQGATTIKRITPNKEIGEMKNTAKGETTAIEREENDLDDMSLSSRYESIIQSWKEGQKLIISHNAYIYKQTESELSPGKDTGDWNPVYNESNTEKLLLKKGSKVTYTGSYEINTNPLSKETTMYVEITNNELTGYVKAQNLSIEEDEIAQTTRISEIDKIPNITSRAKKKVAGKEKEQYVVAIAAGHNEGNSTQDSPGTEVNGLKERELTIKVAEKVEKLLKEYSNVKVVQTGSTSDNPSGVKNKDRVKNARSANPDLCIQIHFNEGGETGVEAIYKEGDGVSQQLAEVLSSSIASAMGLKDRLAGTDEEKGKGSLGIIENSAISGFPSVVTEGGFLDGEPDVSIIKEDGIDKYAKGMVEGIVKYLGMDHSGYSATVVGDSEVTDSIESIVRNMKYVTPEKMQGYIKSGNEEALKVFTLNEENKVITTTWARKADGTIEIKENAPMDLKASLQQYVVPYEYLLYFYIDTNEVDFSEDLADEILNTEIVMAVQDNITTTKKTETTEEMTKASDKEYSKGWKDVKVKGPEIAESCGTVIEVTYADTWCAKSYNESSYSSKVLDMGDKDEIIIEIKGTVTKMESTTTSPVKEKEKGTKGTGEFDDENEEITYTYTTYEKTRTEIETISNSYQSGEMKTEGRESKFVKLYQKNKMVNWVRTEYLFQIMENNEKTANLLNLTKYLIYKATGTSYGVVEYDFSVYDLNSFSDISSSNGLATFKEYLHSWEGHTGISEDGTKYKVGDDGYGHPTVGYGIDIYNSGFLERFQAAGYDVSIGAYIDKEFVDALEDEEIQNAIKTVENKTTGLNLTLYQKYALVSRIYNCGSSGAFTSRKGKTFVEAFHQYWNQETDDEYQVATRDSMYEHQLYAQYMCYPNTSNGQYSKGLENRRKSEWILFKTGYYDRIGKWCSVSEGGTIVECAVEVHKYLRENEYKYGQVGIKVPNLSGKTIDCSSFVTWVLVNAKVSGFTEGMYQWNSSTFASNPLGWKTVLPSEAQPGDILVYPAHVEIVAENDPNSNSFRVYNCGSDTSISAVGTPKLPESSNSGRGKTTTLVILRPPQ